MNLMDMALIAARDECDLLQKRIGELTASSCARLLKINDQRKLLDQYAFMYEVYGFVHQDKCPGGMEHESECTCGLRNDIKKLERLGAPSE
jgi:hypothetical protein